MEDGRLIVEVYEYAEDAVSAPVFEYIPCALKDCLRHNKATLNELIQRGFDALPKKDRNAEKCKEILQKFEDAGIGKIDVSFVKTGGEPYVELTNVVQVSITDANASLKKNKKQNGIILYGKYKLSDGTETTRLRDAQRLSLIYSTWDDTASFTEAPEDGEPPKEICLNITYLQE